MGTVWFERVAVTSLVHLFLVVVAPAMAGRSLAISFSVSVVVLSANALSGKRETPPAKATRRKP